MKNIKIIALLGLGFLTCSVSAKRDLCERLKGLWVLTQMTPVHPQSSSPQGLINARSYFDPESSLLYRSLPDASEEPRSNQTNKPIKYQCEDDVLTLDLKKSPGYSPTTTVSFIKSISDEQLVIEIVTMSDLFGNNETEQVYTKSFFKSKEDRFEPASVQVLQNDDHKLNILDVEYDQNDYSGLALSDKILGVWEVNRYENVNRTEMPPYGLLNDIYTIKENEICMLKRYRPAKTHALTIC